MNFIILLALLVTSVAYGETQEEMEIRHASEAAPAHISDSASFMIFKEGKFQRIKEGTNNFTCMVIRDPMGRFEPSCFNEQAMESVFHTYEMQMRLMNEGKSNEETLSAIGQAFEQGLLPAATTGSLVYMMSPNNKYYNHSSSTLGKSPIHQMYYYPKLDDKTFSLSGDQVILWQGFPHLSALIVIVENGQHKHD